MSTTTYTEYILIVDCVSLAVTNRKGDCDRRADFSSGRQSPRFVKEENSVVRWLPEERKSPLMATGWPQKAEADSDHCKWDQHRPPTPLS